MSLSKEKMPMTVVDPVCGMEVETTEAEWKTEYKGQTYYFCAPSCKQSFERDPEKYLASKPGTVHTHP
jgi:YHS domain-containing protein